MVRGTFSTRTRHRRQRHAENAHGDGREDQHHGDGVDHLRLVEHDHRAGPHAMQEERRDQHGS
nr:hypothetical protein [Marinicella sp. W31]MDC2879710.1 hypothetical protein [Marinicella sp. W31]